MKPGVFPAASFILVPHFRGPRASASLKLHHLDRQLLDPAHFRGPRASASLKLVDGRPAATIPGEHFRGPRASASLKHRADRQNPPLHLRHFRGPRASASLKRRLVGAQRQQERAFPRPTGLGLIEASTSRTAAKPDGAHFRGPRASASLKRHDGFLLVMAVMAISEAHGPRPH